MAVADKTPKVVDDDLTSYIYDTIQRLERLARRLEALTEAEQDEPAKRRQPRKRRTKG